MIKINIVAVGKVKEKYFSQAIEEYSKRLSRFCKLEIIEVKEENFVAEPNDSQIEIIKQKEGENIIKKLSGRVNDMKILIKISYCVFLWGKYRIKLSKMQYHF